MGGYVGNVLIKDYQNLMILV